MIFYFMICHGLYSICDKISLCEKENVLEFRFCFPLNYPFQALKCVLDTWLFSFR